jgi:DNA-binding response OmpR family regulator
MAAKVLVVEDEPDIAHLLVKHLTDIGYAAAWAQDAQSAREAYREGAYQLLILDRMLPDADGLDLCKEIRAIGDFIPILMLTAKSTELDRVLGLELGADDYLTKPFSVPELLARVKALLRRVDALQQAAVSDERAELIRCEGLTIDIGKRHVSVDGESVELTAREFDLLLYFARHPGRVFSRVQLLDKVWGYNHDGYEHTVNSHINRLRAKIERNPAKPRYVLTVWGVGYKFTDKLV